MAAMPSLHSSSPNQTHMPIFTYHSSIFFLCLLFHLISIVASAHFYSDVEDMEGIKIDLFPEVLRDEAVARLNELGKISDTDGYLERTYMSPASIRASNLIRGWMEEAGLRTWVDLMGNVHGRVEGMNTSAKALLIGSHLDTVIDAGIFDGALGIVSALSALKVLNINGQLGKLRRPVEVIAFSDEEGVRFQSTFLGSAALAGILPVSVLQIQDKSGVTLQNVLKENSIEISDESFFGLKYDPEAVWGYIEVHIEQGPVLESVGLPLGVVKGIAGQTRLKIYFSGPASLMLTLEANYRMVNIFDPPL
ncbi:allantoate amidohydrolase [Actinidia rufa]|uniref:Allantoate amidohydrolase n=1 Tax=Actinidia rufa TaxID=165716 RepID=A0A7J0G7H6_9ERIC|nr:allantoate amidohydrolase [Actinidia rufa]